MSKTPLRDQLVQEVLDEKRPRPRCYICGAFIEIEDDKWQAVRSLRGNILFLCGDCMKEGFRLRGQIT